jgi:inhibitor of KinA
LSSYVDVERDIEWSWLGDSCLTLSLGRELTEDTCSKILQLYRRLKVDRKLQRFGLQDVVPAYTSIALYFDPLRRSSVKLRRRVETLIRNEDFAASGSERSTTGDRPREIPVIYDGEDLERLASGAGLSVREAVELHTMPRYTVAMIGFLPHFPYLVGLDRRLAAPRRANPRTRVPAGAVAIGGMQTGIYPQDSPGGWNIIGRTDPALLTPLMPGDAVVFRSVDTLGEEKK